MEEFKPIKKTIMTYLNQSEREIRSHLLPDNKTIYFSIIKHTYLHILNPVYFEAAKRIYDYIFENTKNEYE